MAQAMRTHTGVIVTGKRLNEARKYAAEVTRRCALADIFDFDGDYNHLTPKERGKYAAREMLEVLRIERGECDHNFTIWQRMDYFLTGESVPFLSN